MNNLVLFLNLFPAPSLILFSLIHLLQLCPSSLSTSRFPFLLRGFLRHTASCQCFSQKVYGLEHNCYKSLSRNLGSRVSAGFSYCWLITKCKQCICAVIVFVLGLNKSGTMYINSVYTDFPFFANFHTSLALILVFCGYLILAYIITPLKTKKFSQKIFANFHLVRHETHEDDGFNNYSIMCVFFAVVKFYRAVA